MKIANIIKEKRLQKSLTQEQIANHLGVSAPAVNKWEKGSSYPDITLLPALARLLDTDLNTLLSFQDDLSDQEVAIFLNELAEVLDKKSFEEGYQMAMQKIHDFPTCYSLILYTAYQLEATLSFRKNIDKDAYQTRIHKLYEQVLQSDDLKIRPQAQATLIKKCMEAEDYEHAEMLIQSLPDNISVNKTHMKARLKVARGEYIEASRMEEERLLTTINEVQNILITLLEIALKDGRDEEAKAYADVASQSAKLFDLMEYATHIPYFQYYTIKKMRLQTIKTIAKMLKSISKPWKVNASPLYHHIKTKENGESSKKIQQLLVSSMKDSEELDFVKDSEELNTIIKEYE